MNKGISKILILSVLYVAVGSVYAQAGPTGIGTRNPQGPLHIDGAKDNPTSGVLTPSDAQAANDVIFSNAAGSVGFIGVGTITPKVPLDMRSAPLTNTENALGLGTTTMTATAAGGGATRYDQVLSPGTGPAIDVSDGLNWKRVYVAPQKAVVVARMISGQSIPRGTAAAATTIVGWNEVRDLGNSFNPSTGVFTAPRDGTYTFLLTYDFVSTIIQNGSLVESQFYRTSVPAGALARVYKTFGQSMTGSNDSGEDGGASRQTQAGGSSTVTLDLNAGTTVDTRLRHTLVASGSVSLRVTTNAANPANPDDGFNNLTIIEH